MNPSSRQELESRQSRHDSEGAPSNNTEKTLTQKTLVKRRRLLSLILADARQDAGAYISRWDVGRGAE